MEQTGQTKPIGSNLDLPRWGTTWTTCLGSLWSDQLKLSWSRSQDLASFNFIRNFYDWKVPITDIWTTFWTIPGWRLPGKPAKEPSGVTCSSCPGPDHYIWPGSSSSGTSSIHFLPCRHRHGKIYWEQPWCLSRHGDFFYKSPIVPP